MGLLAFILSLGLCYCVGTAVVVEVNEGKLAGVKRNVSTGLGTLYSFQGIPYAEPPLGKLRFKAPVPHKGWTGIRNATQHGHRCVNIKVTGSEDCLFLNVYTPDLQPKKLFPVVIFFHGGIWKYGSGNENEYGPDFLVVHDVILVTVNFRLDAIGFLCLNTHDVPGNAGMKDQVLAMKWVYNNIKHFGGNHNEITIMGHSSGGSSVIYHMMSPMSKGLFKRGIPMSGLPSNDWALPYEPEERAFQLGNILGKYTNDPEDLLEFLQSVPATKLIGRNAMVLSQEYIWNDILKLNYFLPIVESDFGQERFLLESFKEALVKGNLEDVDLMLGYADKENLLQLPTIEGGFLEVYKLFKELMLSTELMFEIRPKDILPLANKIHHQYFGNRLISIDTLPELIRQKDDHIYIYPTHRFLKYLPNRDSKTFLYKIFSISERNKNSEIGLKYGIHGCAHGEINRYLFSDNRAVDVNSKEYRMINETCILFSNFMKYGNPTPDSSLGVTWPKYDKENKGYMIINETLAIGTNPDAEIFDWWSDVYHSYGIALP